MMDLDQLVGNPTGPQGARGPQVTGRPDPFADATAGDPLSDPTAGEALDAAGPASARPDRQEMPAMDLATNHTPTGPRKADQIAGPSFDVKKRPADFQMASAGARRDPRSWLRRYPGLDAPAGGHGGPTWASLLSQAVYDGTQSGKLPQSVIDDLDNGVMPIKDIAKVLERYRRGIENPWAGEAQAPAADVWSTAFGQVNPALQGAYLLDQMVGRKDFINPQGPTNIPDEQLAGALPAAAIATQLPTMVMGPAAAAMFGAGSDVSMEGSRQMAEYGTVDPMTLAGAGILGAAGNAIPMVGPGSTGGRIMRAAKGAAVGGGYAAGLNTLMNTADERLAPKGSRPPGAEGIPTSTGVVPAAVAGAAFGLPGGKMRTKAQAGKFSDPGLVEQAMIRRKAAAPKPAASHGTPPPPDPNDLAGGATIGGPPGGGGGFWPTSGAGIKPVPSHGPAAPATAVSGTGAEEVAARLQTVNQRLRELNRTKGYGSPEWNDLIKEQRTLSVKQDQAAVAPSKKPKADPVEALKGAQEELDAMLAAGIDPKSPKAQEARRTIAKLKRQQPAAAEAAPAGAPEVLTTPAAAPGKVPGSAEARPEGATAGGLNIKPAAAIPPPPAPTAGPRGGTSTGAHAVTGQRQRFADAHPDLDTLKAKDPKTYEATKAGIDTLVRRLGYAGAKAHVEAIAANRNPTVSIKGKAGGEVVRTTQTLSKTPQTVAQVWREVHPGYEARAKAAGQQTPAQALGRIEVPKEIDEPWRNMVAAHAQNLGREDVLEKLGYSNLDRQTAVNILQSIKATARNRANAAFVPPKTTGNPLDHWSMADITDAARTMFSTKKRPVTEPTKGQTTLAGLRMLERLERLGAEGKAIKGQTPEKILADAKAGLIRESKVNARTKLPDVLGTGGDAAPGAKTGKAEINWAEELPDLGSGMDTSSEPSVTGQAASATRPETLTAAEIAATPTNRQRLPSDKAEAVYPDYGTFSLEDLQARLAKLQKVGTPSDKKELPGLANAIRRRATADQPSAKKYADLKAAKGPAGPEPTAAQAAQLIKASGKKASFDDLAAFAPAIPYPDDDEGDDTNKTMARYARLGLGVAGAASIFSKARSAWRYKGKPLSAEHIPANMPAGRSLAWMSESAARVAEMAERIRAQHPGAEVKTPSVTMPDGGKMHALTVPTELGTNSTFQKRFSIAIEGAEGQAKVASKAQTAKKVPAAPKEFNFENAVDQASEGHIEDQLSGPPDFDFEGNAQPFEDKDFNAFEGAGGGFKRPEPAPVFGAEAPIEPLERTGPPTSKRGDAQWLYDPKEDTRVHLRKPLDKATEAKMHEDLASEGDVQMPRNMDVQKFDPKTNDLNDKDSPINLKVRQIRRERPFAQPTVRKMPEGHYVIEVNNHGYWGPEVSYKSGTPTTAKIGDTYQRSSVRKAHLPTGWKGWSPDYLKTLTKGQQEALTARYAGAATGRTSSTTPGNLRAVEMPSGRSFPLIDQPRRGAPQRVDQRTQLVGVPDEPVPLYKGDHAQIAARVEALGEAFPHLTKKSAAGIYEDLDLSDGHLTLKQKAFEGLSPGEKSYVAALMNSADPKTFQYAEPVEPLVKPVGVGAIGPKGESPAIRTNPIEGLAEAAATIPAGLDPYQARTFQLKHQAKEVNRLANAASVETDPNKKQALMLRLAQAQKVERGLRFNNVKDAARTGNLTLNQAQRAGFKTVEVGNEARMAEIRTALKETFGDAYTDHFSVGYRKNMRAHVLAVSPEALQSGARSLFGRGAGKAVRQLHTGEKSVPVSEALAAVRAQHRSLNPDVGRPIKAGDVVEFQVKGTTAVERATAIDDVDGVVRVRTKSGGTARINKAGVRVVESGGQVVAPTKARVVPRIDNDMVAPLARKLLSRETLTDKELDSVVRMVENEAGKRRESTHDTLAQMYREEGLTPPKRLDLDFDLNPDEVVNDLLWNQNEKHPTPAARHEFNQTIDKYIDGLVKEGLVDADQRDVARLEALRRMVGQKAAGGRPDRVEQLVQHRQQLEEALRGLPRNPFGDSTNLPAGGPSSGSLATSEPSPSPLSLGRPTAKESLTNTLLGMELELRTRAAGRRNAPTYEPIKPPTEREQKVMDLIKKAGGKVPHGFEEPVSKASYEPGATLAPPTEPHRVVVKDRDELNDALNKGVDAVLFFDSKVQRTRPGTAKLWDWVPTASGDRIYAQRTVPQPGEGRAPSTYGELWGDVGYWNKSKRSRAATRLLNPTPSEVAALLSEKSRVVGQGSRREPKIVVIGDDRGVVDFAHQSRQPGGFDWRTALRDLATKVGKPVKDLKLADLKKDWRLLSALPASAAQTSTLGGDPEDPNDPFYVTKRLLPLLAIAAGAYGIARGVKAYRNRPLIPHAPGGGLKIDRQAARQLDWLEKTHRPETDPDSLTFSWARRKLQNQNLLLQQEQDRYPAGSLLPDERAYDVMSTSLGGGGGATDTALRRMREVTADAHQAGLAQQLHNELVIRGHERVQDTFFANENDAAQKVVQLKAQHRAVTRQLNQTPAGPLKRQMGLHRAQVARDLLKTKKALAAATGKVGRLNQGQVLPDQMTPAELAAEKAQIRQRITPGQQTQVDQFADRIYQESRAVVDDFLREGIIDHQTWQDVTSRSAQGYINIRKAMTTVLNNRAVRLSQMFAKPDISVTSDRVIKFLKDPAGLDPVHPLVGTMSLVREGNQELAMQKTARSMVQLLKLDPTHQVRVVNSQKPADKRWMAANGMGSISFMDNGKVVEYAVPERFAKLAVAAATPPQKSEGLMRILDKTRQVSMAGMTWLNPVFQAKNVIRDVQSARKNLPEVFSRWNPVDQIKTYTDWGQSLKEVLANSPDFQDMMESGAGYSTYSKGQDPTLYLDFLEDSILGQKGAMVKVRNMREAMSAFEEATKLMTYKRLTKKGITGLDRATLTRRYGGSPDFWVSGDWGRHIGQAALFFNPAIQGVNQTLTSLGRGNNLAWAAAGTMGAALLADQWNNAYRDEKGDPEILHVDRSVRSSNHVMFLPFRTTTDDGREAWRYLAIPKDHPAQLMHAMADAAIDYARGRATGVEAVRQGVTNAANKVSPFGSSFEFDKPGSLLESAGASVHPVLRVPFEMGRDRTLFGNRPIEGQGLERVERAERSRPSTPALFKDLGQAARPLTADKQGLSPLMLKYGIRSAAPGPVDLATDVYGAAGRLFGRPPERTPVAGGMAAAFTGPGPSDQQLDDLKNRFYRALDTANTTATTQRALSEQGRDAEAEKLQHPGKMLNKVSQSLAKLRQYRTQLLKAGGDHAAELKDLRAQEVQLLQDVGKELDRFGAAYAK